MSEQTEQQYYARHLTLPEIGVQGQQKLKAAKVLVVGAGGLGCPILQYLAGAGVGTIGIIDHDQVDLSNIHRQILFTPSEVGMPKAEIAAKKIGQLNPFIKINYAVKALDKSNVFDFFEPYDLILDATDNFATRYLINDACVLMNKPLIFGAIHQFEGQVTVFNLLQNGEFGPNYRDLFPTPPSDEEIPNCAEAGVLGVLPGLVGCMQAIEAIKVICEFGHPLSGKLMTLDTRNMRFFPLEFSGNSRESITELGEYDIQCAVSEEIESLPTSEHLLVDIRTNEERASGYLPNSIHIEMDLLEENLNQLKQESRDIVLYCQSGKRSLKTMRLLRDQHGFTNIYSLKGGILRHL